MSKENYLSGSPEPEIVNSILDMSCLIRKYMAHAPRHEKYALCCRILNTVDEFYEMIIDAQFSRGKQRVSILKKSDKTLNRLKFLLLGYYKHGYFQYKHNRRTQTSREANRKYKSLQIHLTSVGSQLGGWLSHESKKL